MKSHPILKLGLVAVLVAATPQARSEYQENDEESHWVEVTELRLAPSAMAQLERDGLLIVDEPWRQIFSPYLSYDFPVFVTSDSLLNAFHVLFAESIMRLEEASARRLPAILNIVWSNLAPAEAAARGDPATIADASRRARVVIGTALRLLGEEPLDADPAIEALIAEEKEHVMEARAQTKPAWLGPPDDGFVAIDYSRFVPRGFYATNEQLSRYFRAVAWLQAIPFRVEHDSELLAALIIGNTISYERVGSFGEVIWTQLRIFRELLGDADDWDMLDMGRYGIAESQPDTDRLDEVRYWMRKHTTGDSLISDQVRYPPATEEAVSERSFRVLAAHRTPDAVLFQRTTGPEMPGRGYPSGLEVAAMLGSEFARDRIEFADRERLLEELDRARGLLGQYNLYAQYLSCIAALFEAPDPAAPAFMSGEAWAAKSCQTALAGWSQLRHTWALQAKQSVLYLSGIITQPGFVEPVPEFFARMGTLVRNTEMLLKSSGAFERRDVQDDVLVRELADEMERTIKELRPDIAFSVTELSDEPGFGAIGGLFPELVRPILSPIIDWSKQDGRAVAAEVVSALQELANDLATGEQSLPAEVRRYLADGGLQPIEGLWRRLSDLCMQLEIIAHKQLRGSPLSERDRAILCDYGAQIAGIMLYGGNSYVSPRDDAPRAIDVHWNPAEGKGLIVGIGRPRTLYVLYPTDEGPVLCRGAIMPYFEFISDRRLTDAEWRHLLDSDERPAIPTWLEPIIYEGELGSQVPR